MNASLTRLQSFYGEFKTPLLLHAILRREFPGSVAALAAFGPDCALLLALIAEADPSTPVIFASDGPPPHEARSYALDLAAKLGLARLHWLAASPLRKSDLSQLAESLGLLALITGRDGPGLETIELDENGVFIINPLAGRPKEAQKSRMQTYGLPLSPPDIPGLPAKGWAERLWPERDRGKDAVSSLPPPSWNL